MMSVTKWRLIYHPMRMRWWWCIDVMQDGGWGIYGKCPHESLQNRRERTNENLIATLTTDIARWMSCARGNAKTRLCHVRMLWHTLWIYLRRMSGRLTIGFASATADARTCAGAEASARHELLHEWTHGHNCVTRVPSVIHSGIGKYDGTPTTPGWGEKQYQWQNIQDSLMNQKWGHTWRQMTVVRRAFDKQQCESLRMQNRLVWCINDSITKCMKNVFYLPERFLEAHLALRGVKLEAEARGARVEDADSV